MSETHCPECESFEWKSAKMVMLEGVTASDGNTTGGIVEKGLFSSKSGYEVFFGSDRWFDFEKYSTHSSIKMETVSALAQAVEAAVIKEGDQLKKPSAPVEPEAPREPSSPRRSRPSALSEFKPPTAISRAKMWWNRRSGDPLLVAIIFALWLAFTNSNPEITFFEHAYQRIASIWMPFGAIALAIFTLYLISGYLGLEKYNAKREHKARRKLASERAANESARKRYEKYDADVAEWESEKQTYDEDLKNWRNRYQTWQLIVSDIEAQRIALWDQLRVCLRCAHVYTVQDTAASHDTGEEGLASMLGDSARKATGAVTGSAGASADAIKDLAGRTSNAASAVGNKINGIFNRDASE
ncbi:hypothetical protein MGP2080_06137 [marine gamma proteobacterium HTCC2080]|nr:hypothetical protein MGP2080_06137 [marine gamma proteobacterium HTCC2080]